MNILGLGFWELVLIVIIMLVVAGPQRMLQWAYHAGKLLAKARDMWSKLMLNVQRELDEAGLDVELPKDLNRTQIEKFTRNVMKPLQEPIQQGMRAYQQEVKKLESEVKGQVKQLETEATQPDRTPPQVDASSKPQPQQPNSSFGTWSGRSGQKG
ncbi:MAG: hypothetical protein Kow00117_02050 [Phototrophicales bacterium]